MIFVFILSKITLENKTSESRAPKGYQHFTHIFVIDIYVSMYSCVCVSMNTGLLYEMSILPCVVVKTFESQISNQSVIGYQQSRAFDYF